MDPKDRERFNSLMLDPKRNLEQVAPLLLTLVNENYGRTKIPVRCREDACSTVTAHLINVIVDPDNEAKIDDPYSYYNAAALNAFNTFRVVVSREPETYGSLPNTENNTPLVDRIPEKQHRKYRSRHGKYAQNAVDKIIQRTVDAYLEEKNNNGPALVLAELLVHAMQQVRYELTGEYLPLNSPPYHTQGRGHA